MVIVVMGVSGSGKSTVGRMLAERLGWEFWEGDDFHTPANIRKMERGVPLTDADRAPWLAEIAGVVRDSVARGDSGVLACSSLRESYRRTIRGESTDVAFVHLDGSRELFLDRLNRRHGHFAGPELLDSQLARLEAPQDALILDAAKSPEELTTEACRFLGLG